MLAVQEISKAQPDVAQALAELHARPVVDILDESDALLSCRQQLIYAWGVQEALPDDAVRWNVQMEILHAIAEDADVQAMLQDPLLAEVVHYPGRPGAMPETRLVRGAPLACNTSRRDGSSSVSGARQRAWAT